MELDNIFKLNSVLIKKVKNFILSSENWIYYFINDKNVLLLVTQHPNDWSDYVELSVEYIKDASAFITVKVDNEDSDYIETLGQFVSLPIFEWTVEANYRKYGENALLTTIKNYEKELAYFEGKVNEMKDKINKLKDKQNETES